MDKVEMRDLFQGAYYGKRVFITGHTGFKGSWLSLWLNKMGAIVKGYSLPPQPGPNHWDLLKLDIESVYGDIRDAETLENEISKFQPDIIFHLAAQAIVRYSYICPVETYETNIIGTLKLFEACRKVDSVRAIVNVTSDKCYDNKEWIYGYRENDPMGGHDPYSSSKGCAEILTSSYRNSFWDTDKFDAEHHVLLASCRAGNVIAGGDWAQDRLIPDIVRAVANNENLVIRNPYATRPWQHVLDPLSGYLLVGQNLLDQKKLFAKAWNFGPSDESCLYVKDVIIKMQESWPELNVIYDNSTKPHEARLLKLDCSQAHVELLWKPVWGYNSIFRKTAEWYKEYSRNNRIISSDQIDEYVSEARDNELVWTK